MGQIHVRDALKVC